MTDQLLSVAQVAARLSVHPSTVRRWIERGDLVSFRIGQRRIAIRETDLTGLVTPRNGTGDLPDVRQESSLVVEPLTDAEVEQALRTMERVQRLQETFFGQGGKLEPESWILLNESRDERSGAGRYDAMSIEENKAVIKRVMEEVVNAGNIEAVDELLAPDFVNHNPMPGGTPDREGFKQAFRGLHAAFSDLHAINSDLVAEGDRVVALRGFEGTHDGPFMGVPPTGKHITLDGIAVFRVMNGRVSERWAVLDTMGLMRQLDLNDLGTSS